MVFSKFYLTIGSIEKILMEYSVTAKIPAVHAYSAAARMNANMPGQMKIGIISVKPRRLRI